jgi:N-acetylneuraminate synthase
MSILKIKNRVIGNGQPPLIIAEIGINHNGSLNKAIQMIDDAYDAGCECVKFQFHIPDKEMIPNKVIPGNTNKSIWDVIEKATLTEKEENIIKNYVNKKKMIYLSTPFSKEAAYKLNKMKVDWFKIGSGECNNYPLIEYISRLKKPIILSTGMNNIQSIKKSVQIFEKYHLTYALLHCTSIYPCPSKNINLISGYFSGSSNIQRINCSCTNKDCSLLCK